MSDHPYHIVVTPGEWDTLQMMMKQQNITEFTLLDERSHNVLKDDRYKVKEAAKVAKSGCHITFDPPRPPRHNGRTQMPRARPEEKANLPRPKPMPPVKK